MHAKLSLAIKEIGKIVLGKKKQVKLALTCFLAQGHLLIEDLPGIGKTTLAQCLSKTLGLDFTRIQFTSDLLPGDILGVSIYEQQISSFTFHPGPIFTQVLLADEINRATPKTQSALLEAMEEGQVTIEGTTRKLKHPFFVIATQNPLEQSGTFALPESQKDRFLIRLAMGYPDRKSENLILKQDIHRTNIADLPSIITQQELLEMQKQVPQVHSSEIVIEYIQDLLDFSRSSSEFETGLSPRAGLGLLRAAKAWAFSEGRNYLMPEDVRAVLPWVTGHRLCSAQGGCFSAGEDLMDIFNKVPIPI